MYSLRTGPKPQTLNRAQAAHHAADVSCYRINRLVPNKGGPKRKHVFRKLGIQRCSQDSEPQNKDAP